MVTVTFAILLAMMPGALGGSRHSQEQQNRMADRFKLSRIKDRAELERFIRAGLLVPVADADAYFIDATVGELDPDHRALYAHARPWVKMFLDRELGEVRRATGARLKITSLVRTRPYQRELSRHNRNAIRGTSWRNQSSHLTGSTVDISRLDLPPAVIRHLEKRLRELRLRGLIIVVRERHNACWHVMVSPRYANQRPAPR